MTRDEIRARDRRRAAYHEAGHVVVAAVLDERYLGAGLIEHDDADPRYLRLVSGQAGGYGFFSPEISIAGILAELMVDDEGSSDGPHELIDYLEDGVIELSETDVRGLSLGAAGFASVLPAANRAWQALKENESFLHWVAEELLTADVITDGMVRDYLHPS